MEKAPIAAGPLEAFVRQTEPALADAIQHAQEVAEREGCTDCGNEHRQLAAWLRRLVRMEHDFPRLSEFHHKYALGPMLPPSCFVCGHPTLPLELGASCSVAIQHAELPGIVVCLQCRDAAIRPRSPHPSLSKNRPAEIIMRLALRRRRQDQRHARLDRTGQPARTQARLPLSAPDHHLIGPLTSSPA